MNILTQSFQNIYTQEITNRLNQKIQEYINPTCFTQSSLDYGDFISRLSTTVQELARAILVQTFEEMDKAFRNSPQRTKQYYVKQTRSRTIITVYGEITYRRTEYVNRQTKKPYCYVDRKLKIKSRERYDSTIKSLVIETYADQNSMIKVGKLIGDRIGNFYSLDSNRTAHALPRQTVFNILNAAKRVILPAQPVDVTPETLYIMADEKYVPLQNEEGEHPKAMIKAAVVFDGRNKVSDNSKKPRYELNNKFTYASTEGKFWETMHDFLNTRYDLSLLKQIYVLGDGASWIKSGRDELSTATTKATFALDKFHACQAIQRITKDKTLSSVLTQYMIHNMKDDFIQTTNILMSDYPDRAEAIVKQQSYLLTHWNDIQTMYKTVKIGCAMEQAIYHNIASVFTSVPKAYSKEHIVTYLASRIHHQNNCDLRKLTLLANDIDTDKPYVEIKPDSFDFSMFDTQNLTSTYPLHLSNKHYETITKF